MTNNMDNDLEYQYINDIFDFRITRFITGLATAGKNQKNVGVYGILCKRPVHVFSILPSKTMQK